MVIMVDVVSFESVAVVADGVVLPVQSEAADLVCFAHPLHWIDESSRVAEAHRVLPRGGRWAAWWSHARADGKQWFDKHWTAIERSCLGTHRTQRDTEWGATIGGPGRFEVDERVTISWVRYEIWLWIATRT